MQKTDFAPSDVLSPCDIARSARAAFDRSRRARLIGIVRVLRCCAEGLIEGIRTARAMPVQGDVGTRGGDLTCWIGERNGRD